MQYHVYILNLIKLTNIIKNIVLWYFNVLDTEIKNGDATVLFASPDAIISKHWLRVLQDVYKENITLVAYDEAHCISEWYSIILDTVWNMLH